MFFFGQLHMQVFNAFHDQLIDH